MFSKIIENLKGDFSKFSQNKNNDFVSSSEQIKERAKSSKNSKNIYPSKYSLSDTQQSNKKNGVTKNDNTTNYQSLNENNLNMNKDQNTFNKNINSANFSSSNIDNKNLKNTSSQEFIKQIKNNDKFNLDNFKLSNSDFHYNNNFESSQNMQIIYDNIENNSLNPIKVNENFDAEKSIHDYRLQLNKELLRRLYEEREKENIRDKLLKNIKNNFDRKKLEQRFIIERAEASADIVKINE